MKKQLKIAIITLIVSVLVAVLTNNETFLIRALLGLSLGYVLTRGFFGFAGSVNRACRFNSNNLTRALMLMFIVTSIGMFFVLLIGGIENYDLWINPINLGLIIGGILFGCFFLFCFEFFGLVLVMFF